jgi:hypothetical protein
MAIMIIQTITSGAPALRHPNHDTLSADDLYDRAVELSDRFMKLETTGLE